MHTFTADNGEEFHGHAEIDRVVDCLNNRPRKSLGMLTPHQVLRGIKHGVALAS